MSARKIFKLFILIVAAIFVIFNLKLFNIIISYAEWTPDPQPRLLCHIPLPPIPSTPKVKNNKTVKHPPAKRLPPPCIEPKRSPLVTHTCTKMSINSSALKEYGANNTDIYMDCCYAPLLEGNRMGKTCIRFRKELPGPYQYILVTCYVFNPNNLLADMFDETIAFFHDNFIYRRNTGGTNVVLLRIIEFPIENSLRTNAMLRSMLSVEMKGFSKMSNSDLGNMVPLLTGFTETSFKRSCSVNQSEFCPFLWRTLAPGQVSMLIMNAPTGLTFRYPPTDFYPETFMKVSGVRSCSASKKALQYVSKLFSCVRAPIFATVWLSDATDKEVAEFLKNSRNKMLSYATLVLYAGDILHILSPPSFRKEYPGKWTNLQYNSRLLTTPIDMHETLRDLLLLPKSGRHPFATSLFSRVPLKRNCNDLGVPHHLCKCKYYTTISTSDPILRSLAKGIVRKVCPGTPVRFIQQAMVIGKLYYLVVQAPEDTFEGIVQLYNSTKLIVYHARCKICSCRNLK